MARDTGLCLGDLTGPQRGGHVARARYLAAYLARRLGRISVRRIARSLRRDESSFVRPLARLERSLETDTALAQQIDRIARSLKSANQD